MIEGTDPFFTVELTPVPRADLFSLRVVTFAPRAADQRWITEELEGTRAIPYFVPTLRSVFDAIADEVGHRVIVIAYDALSREDIVDLRAHRARARGGTFIALGNIREHLRAPLRVTHVLPRPLGSEVLRGIIDGLDRQRDTAEIRKLDS
ncbi:MAG TPA: hypothetical protein VMZ53_06935 [Kofleriaceae bacterium]|nr:hypothetical protein [Kofleriaceae bacterium]